LFSTAIRLIDVSEPLLRENLSNTFHLSSPERMVTYSWIRC
jgi:hypothetical protein